jgi:hypothetical protein
MRPGTSTWIRGRVIAATLAVTVALAGPAGASSQYQVTGSKALVGAWTVEITLRDCNTNAPLGAPFPALISFHDGGTLTDSYALSAFAIGQRSPAHGAWVHDNDRTFRSQMVAIIAFDTAPNLPGPGFDPAKPVTPGFFAGWKTITHTVVLTSADESVSSGTHAFYKANGDVYRTGCSTTVGRRVQV